MQAESQLNSGSKINRKIILAVLTLYAVIAIFLLYPLPLHFFEAVPGGGLDTYGIAWDFWIFKHALFQGQNPYYTNFVYYPTGHELITAGLLPLYGIMSIPLEALFGFVFTYNFFIILAYVVGAFGAFLLAHYITKNVLASFLGGIVFAFAPYVMGQTLGHLSLVSIEGIPFFILFLLKMKEKKAKFSPIYAAISLLVVYFTAEIYYVFFLMIFTILFLLYMILFDKKSLSLSLVLRIAIAFCIFIIPISVIMSPLIPDKQSVGFAYSPISVDIDYSNSVQSFFIPSTTNKLFATNFTPNAGIVEGNGYIGYSVLAMAIYGLVFNRKISRFWLVSAGLFSVLSMGPFLQILNHVNTGIPLPYLALFKIPLVQIFRSPARIEIIATLSLAMVSALSFDRISIMLKKMKKKNFVIILLILLCTLVLVEYNALPYPINADWKIPAFYSQLHSMNETFSVLDLPAGYDLLYSWPNAKYMYYSTESEKPIITGYLARTDIKVINEKVEIPILNYAEALAMNKTELDYKLPFFSTDSLSTDVCAMKVFNTKYVIVHKQYYSDKKLDDLSKRLSTFTDVVYDDNIISAFQVKNNNSNCFYAYGQSGWYGTGKWGNSTVRFDDGQGIAKIVSTTTQKIKMSFIAAHFYTEDDLSIYVNGKLFKTVQLSMPGFEGGKGFLPVELDDIQLNKGYNEIKFVSSKGCTIPRAVNFNPDPRCIGVEYQNFDTRIKS